MNLQRDNWHKLLRYKFIVHNIVKQNWDLTSCSNRGCTHVSSAPSTIESHSKHILSTWIETSDSTWTGCTFDTTW